METALQGLCEEGTVPNIKTEDKGNNYKFIVKPKMEKDKIPHFIRFKDAEGAAQVAVIHLSERRMLCPNCKTDRHYPTMCNQLYARFMDGIQKKDGKYVVIKPWGEQEKEAQRQRLQNDKRSLETWDEDEITELRKRKGKEISVSTARRDQSLKRKREANTNKQLGSIKIVDGEESPSIFNNTPLSQPCCSDQVQRGIDKTNQLKVTLEKVKSPEDKELPESDRDEHMTPTAYILQ